MISVCPTVLVMNEGLRSDLYFSCNKRPSQLGVSTDSGLFVSSCLVGNNVFEFN